MIKIFVIVIIIWTSIAVSMWNTEDVEASTPTIALIDGREHGEWIKSNYDALQVRYNYYPLDNYDNLEQLLAQARVNKEQIVVVEAILINKLWLNEVKMLHDQGAVVYLPAGWYNVRVDSAYAQYATIVGAKDFWGEEIPYLNNNDVEKWVYGCEWAWMCSTSEAVAKAAIGR